MYDKEIRFIADFNLNKVSPSQQGYTLQNLKELGLHPAIIQFVSAELDYLIYLDRKTLLQKSSFDYSGSQISQYFALISSEIKKYKRLSYDAVKRLILQAISFNFNYLVRPKWSLEKLIFNNSISKPVEEIRYFLKYTYYYEFIKKIISIFVEKKKLQTLNSEEFVNIFNKMEAELIQNQLPEILDYFLLSCAEFINQGEPKKFMIPLYLLQKFLEEKDLKELMAKIEILELDPKKKINVQEAKKYLLETQIHPLTSTETPVSTPNLTEQQKQKYRRTMEEVPEEEPVLDIPKNQIGLEFKQDDPFSHEKEREEIVNDGVLNNIDLPTNLEDENPVEKIDETSLKTIQENVKEDFTFVPLDEPFEMIDETTTESVEDFKSKFEPEEEIEPTRFDSKVDTQEEIEETVNEHTVGNAFTVEAPTERNPFDEEVISGRPIEEAKDYLSELESEVKFGIDDFKTEAPAENNLSMEGKLLMDKFSEDKQDEIIKNLYDNNKESFISFIDRVAKSSDYEVAIQQLRDETYRLKADPFSKNVFLIANNIENYFKQGS